MKTTTRDLNALTVRAQLALGLPHREFGALLGSSQRTSERWSADESTPSRAQLGELAKHVRAKDPALAAEIAAAIGLPIEVASPAPSPAAPSPSPTRAISAAELVDLVVCAAAETMDVSPRAIRPALRAAFARARELALDVATLATALDPTGTNPSR